MRYMMLIYTKVAEVAKQSCEEMQEFPAAHQAIMGEASRRGIFRGAEALEGAAGATTVRLQNGRVLITDGPFAETKEQLAGYYMLDCKDLDEALEWAGKIGAACGAVSVDGCVEVRAIREMTARIDDSRSAEYAKSVNG